MNYYGNRTKGEIKKVVHNICVIFGNNNPDLISRSEALCNETLCAESRYGQEPDHTETTGIGIAQFDPVGYYDMKRNSMKYSDLIFEKFKFEMDILLLEHSRYDEVTSILYMRLKYKRDPNKIPGNRKERSNYWKDVYNTVAGAGTPEHYVENSNKILGEIKCQD